MLNLIKCNLQNLKKLDINNLLFQKMRLSSKTVDETKLDT